MKIYTATSWSKKIVEQSVQLGIGWMTSPHDLVKPNTIDPRIPFALDNGAFRAYKNNQPWDDKLFYETLDNLDRDPDFIAIPDIVAAGMDSYHHSLKNFLTNYPYKRYFVVQDGMYPEAVFYAISECAGVFVGGTIDWKWDTAKIWIDTAHDIGIKCHIGRCSTPKDLTRAYVLGADSVDGSTLMRNGRLNEIDLWREYLKEQHTLDLSPLSKL